MANLTLEDIANISFPRANFGGYRAEDVDAFIDDVQVSYDNVLKESAELKRKLAILAQKVEEYRNEEDSIRNTLLSAQKLADAQCGKPSIKPRLSWRMLRKRRSALFSAPKRRPTARRASWAD